MPSRSLKLDQGAINRLLHGRGGDVNRMMGGFAGLATQAVRETSDERITHRTGNYRRSIKATLETPDRLRVEASAKNALYLERGTPAHTITGNPLLVFFWPKAGRTMFLHSVNHPGTQPYNILRDGVRRAGTRLNRLAR